MARHGAAVLRGSTHPVHPTNRQRRRRRGESLSSRIAAFAAILAVPALVGLGHVATASTLQVPTTAAASPHASNSATPRGPAEGTNLQEGRDYAFQGRVHHVPIHWPCSNAIPVVIDGVAPRGADAALELVVARLREVSKLPLVARAASKIPSSGEGAIRIRYVNEGETVYEMNLAGDVVGKEGSTFDARGIILSGRVIVRDDMDPTTPAGMQVLMHEIGHALGLDHSEEGMPEVMAPTSLPGAKPVLGPGDRVALHAVGC